MKYSQILDMNMVPEWRNKYLDYHELNAILNKAIESKNMKTSDKGLDSYFELIKFNQKFGNFFNRECQTQLDKINGFHKEKLNEMRGKFNNLQDQLEQVLTSAVYREIQPDYYYQNQQQTMNDSSASNYSTVTSISELFRNIRNSVSGSKLNMSNQQSATDQSGATTILADNLRPKLLPKLASRLSISSPFSNDLQTRRNSNFRLDVRQVMRKLSDSFTGNTNQQQQPNAIQRLVKTTRRGSEQQFAVDGNSKPRMSPLLMKIFDGSNSNNILSSSATNESLSESAAASDRLVANETLASATPQSKKRIIASYKRKLSNLKFAFRELYFNLVLFEQYTQLNYSGFEQILRKHDRMFASTLGRKFYQEYVQTADFHINLHEIDQLIEKVEHVYTLHFENGNRRKAIEKLQVPTSVYRPTSPILDFRVGYELGAVSILFALVILVGFISQTDYDWRTVFRLYRSPLTLIIFLFQTGISIIIWKHYKINHVLIFELNPRNNLSFQHFLEFASLLGIIWSISVVLFLFSSQLGIKPSLCPLVVVVIIALYLFNPTQTAHFQARFWFLRILGRIFTAPLHPVRFADFWVADQLVSIVPFFLDLEYLSCFYTTGDVLSVSYLNSDYASRCVTKCPKDLVIRTIVAALPAWFRCAQCLRRWRDENWLRLHLANAGKYWCMVMVVVLSSISQYNKSQFEFFDTLRIIWMVAAIFTSSLTAWWDIIYDFGLFNTYDKSDQEDQEHSSSSSSHSAVRKTKSNSTISSASSSDSTFFDNKLDNNRRKNKTYPFLRKELVYPVWVYYFAIIENVILRFGWIITISLTEFSGIEAGLVVSLLAPMEMFRRFVWNCIRLENEQLNNCGLFRAVRDIPIEVVAPIDESHLDKVIMMMDSRDGPSMRNRLMKRRTLRPDRVSFMVLENPSSPMIKRSDLRFKY